MRNGLFTLLSPILLHYYITDRCNCACTFCDIWKNRADERSDARLSDVVKNLRDAREIGARFVDFTGGEPLLHEQLPQMLQEAKRLKYKTSITTNCLRYTQVAADLRGLIDFLHFSLDGLSATKHDAMRGRDSFECVMQSIDRARELGEAPDLLFTVTSKNIDHLAPLAEFARTLGLILLVNPAFATSVSRPDIGLLGAIERYSSQPFVYVNKAFHHLRRNGGNNTSAPRCRVLDAAIVISPDNKVVLPCFHFQQLKIALHESAEDLGLSTLMKIRHSAVWAYYQKEQGRFNFCHGCHLNCYFDPSFHHKADEYFWLSFIAKSRYWWNKYIRKRMEKRKFDSRPASAIAAEIMKKHDDRI
ncbi:radical SAM protein [candidate division KSB1 bacterium]|nr:radical SAM protein [candidate division KSB1 bacterium]RQW08042.1 MAG: radical SAM protein [candidate division KSB1 bacterium]